MYNVHLSSQIYVGDTVKQVFCFTLLCILLGLVQLQFLHCFTVIVHSLIHLAGEPLDVKAWNWYHHQVGQGRCRVVDAWWQTG